MKINTMEKKIKVLEHAFAENVGAYYNINLTKDLVPGFMYQVIEDKEYSLNKQMGLSDNARFTDVVSCWGEKLDSEEQPAYYDFLSIPRLLECYKRGERHVFFKYWTRSAIFEPMLAEQHIVMYKDEESGDILAITYVLDLTKKFNEEKYKKELEKKQTKLEAALDEAKKVSQYREIQAAVTAVDDILNKLNIFDKISSEEELNLILPDLLASLGRYSMSDRAYIFTWASMEEQILHMTHEWCAEGVVPTLGDMQNLKMSDLPNWAERLRNGEAIVSQDWDSEKKKTPEEYKIFDGQNIHSLIVIPIFANNKLNGYIGFDNPEQSRAALSIRLLSSIGGHISSLKDNFFMMGELERKQKHLESSLKQIRREKNILDALSVDYTSVYYCDLMADTMIALKQEEDSNAAVTETRIADGLQSYSFRIQYYYDTFVIKESAPDFLHKLSVEYLKEYLAHNERLAYRFRTHPNPAGQQYFEVQIVRLPNSSGFKTVMGYRYIDDIIEEQERQKIRLENALAETKFHSQVVGAIGKLYWIIYQMDLVNGTYEEISAGSDVHKLTGKRGNTEEVFKGVRESVVATEHQKVVEEFLDVSTLQERLYNTESISTEYRTENGAWHRARFIVKSRDETGKVLNVLYVVRQINEEKQAEIKYKEEILEKNRVLSGLSLDYTIAFILNLDTDDYKIIFNQKTNHAKRMKSITKFADYVEGYTENFVLPRLQEEMKRELSSTHIKKRFEIEEEYHFSFETVPNAAGLSCFQAHIIKQYDGDNHFAFLGFRSVDEAVKKERFYKEALQKANQALQQQLNMITFALPGGVKISNDDATYSFKYVSEQFAQMLGYETPEELMKASAGSILGLAHPDDIETGLADALEQYTRSDHYTTTYRVKCKDGSWKYIEDRGHKVISEDGNIEHWNLILDKNELMEKTIALEIEKKANQNKSEFLSRMSHDMRTPLNGIIGLLDICERHSDDRNLVDASRLKAKVAAGHLLSLVNDSLELNKLESESVTLHEEIFHIPALMEEVNTIAQMQADEGKINISYNEDTNSLKYPYLIGSPLYVKQILLNLITNGIKYNKNNGSVEYSLLEKQISQTQVVLEFTVKDTGIGMKQEFLKDIFKPFVQEDNGARSTYNGNGLGMAIVKNLINRMEGTIEIHSTEGVGTTINVTIPFKIADTGNDITGKISENLLPVNHNRKLRILLAEDNELNREIAAFVLRDEGIEVIEVVNGQQAVAAFLENTEYYFDAVLMDIMMPVMDGYQATSSIRNSGRKDARTIPVIAMTANAFDGAQEKSKAAGMNAHLLKPLDAKKLVKTIENLCYKE